MRALVIDDDPISAEFLRIWLLDCGWQVAMGGRLAAINQNDYPAPDWLILDRRLPDGDGLDWLRTSDQAATLTRAGVKVLLLSGDDLTDLAPPGVWHLRKPVHPDRLHAVLTSVAASTRHNAAAAASVVADLEDAPALRALNGNAAALSALRGMLRKELSDASWLADLERAEQARSVQAQLHRLRAAAALVGATRVAALAEPMEMQLRAGRPLAADQCAALTVAIEALLTKL